MKKLAILFASMFIMAIAVQNVNAQATSATAASSAAANIIAPITLANTDGLVFGNIAASNAIGTVTISPAGARSHTGGVTPSVIGDFQQAVFQAGGEEAATYAITLPASVTISAGAGLNMTVNNFTSDPVGTGVLGVAGQTINVGATLNVGASQASGEYVGTFNVTIAYN